ncbi:MAG: hypothetical protein ACRDRH_02010 [Pseudonocardia sp.]
MGDLAPIVATVSEVRGVVETFRRCATLELGWAKVIESAAERLDSARGDQVGELSTREVAQRLRKLLVAGAWTDRALVDRVAVDAAELIQLTWPAGLPRPEDDDWSFPAASRA